MQGRTHGGGRGRQRLRTRQSIDQQTQMQCVGVVVVTLCRLLYVLTVLDAVHMAKRLHKRQCQCKAKGTKPNVN